jgi:hypothetical protein
VGKAGVPVVTIVETDYADAFGQQPLSKMGSHEACTTSEYGAFAHRLGPLPEIQRCIASTYDTRASIEPRVFEPYQYMGRSATITCGRNSKVYC